MSDASFAYVCFVVGAIAFLFAILMHDPPFLILGIFALARLSLVPAATDMWD